MKKTLYKIIPILILMFIIFSTVYVYANPIDDIKARNPGDGAITEFNSLRGKIYTIIRGVGTGIAVIAILVLAIKYITSAPNDRAELKKYMITYVISAVIFFGAVGIVEVLKAFGQGLGQGNY